MDETFKEPKLRFFKICDQPGFEAAEVILASMPNLESIYLELKENPKINRIFWCHSMKLIWMEIEKINVSIFDNGKIHFLRVQNRNELKKVVKLLLNIISNQLF